QALVQLHTADAEQRQHRERHDDDPQSAEPVQHVSPEVQRRRQIVQPGEHRRAGGGEPRHGLEEGPGEAEPPQRQQQRQRRGGRQQQPAERHQQKPVARLELAPEGEGRDGERQPAAGGDGGGQQEFRPEMIREQQRAADGERVAQREAREQEPEEMRDREHRWRFPYPAERRNSRSTASRWRRSARNRITWSSACTSVSWCAMITSSPRTTAPIEAPSGSAICPTILPTKREERSSPCTIASIASAAPRLRACTRTTSPRRTCASSEPMVMVCGEMAMSMLLLSTSSV